MDQLDQFRKSLPIYSVRNKLIYEIQRNPTLVLLGETGCGKTTQIPQYIHEAQPQMRGLIGCTQPRRVAAITVAQRVAQETKTQLGHLTGYCVRFEDVTSAETKIKYMTDGMLLREAIADPLLTRYAVIILDEVHERTIHTDVLLGVVKSAQARRANGCKNTNTTATTTTAATTTNNNNKHDNKFLKPLKVIVMSATMDVDEFSLYFGKAPVFYLEGRLHPVEVFHTADKQTDYVYSALTAVFQIHRSAPVDEDILLFMTGQEEIDSTVRTLTQFSRTVGSGPPMLVLPLYAALPSAKQLKVFEKAPEGHRKVIVSTNIAETSITIRGIKHVVDTGMIKGKLYNPQTQLELLKVHKISKSQAWQRTGRAGRESAGTCYRLYTEAEYESMPLNTVPEILRSNLLSVVLHLLALGIHDLLGFDFMSKPSVDALSAALAELELLGAVRQRGSSTNGDSETKENGNSNNSDHAPVSKKPKLDAQDDYELTEIGLRMVQFPLDPKLARCILAAEKLQCVEEVLKIVSVLSVENVFVNDAAKRDHISAVRQKFVSADGDHITLLNIYKAFVANRSVKEWCHENYLDGKNLKLATDICQQLREICLRNRVKLVSSNNNTVNIRHALIAGFFMNAAEYFKENEYKTISTRQVVYIHPTSVLFGSKPSCIVYNELVQTNKTYMRDVSVISSSWLLEANPAYFRTKLITNVDSSTNNLSFNANKIR